ncbi:pilus assembly protein N-terminal domain-containing protein [uncultured Tateyamaria sp.]|uniref:pilus assembly protein N-terminal domain-containing protein n=2 Tax=uncultured Tateyamaria sp. TaxID=455651 RepID=UPI0026185D16|nr:pilus assembly protein N-terminal domain-containing protein [uncultured Tateyamaria sp.]
MKPTPLTHAAFGAVLSCLIAAPLPLGAENPDFVSMIESDGQMMYIDFTPTSVLVANPAVADVQIVSDSSIFVFGKAPGRTKLIILDQAGQVALSRVIIINRSLSRMAGINSGT